MHCRKTKEPWVIYNINSPYKFYMVELSQKKRRNVLNI